MLVGYQVGFTAGSICFQISRYVLAGGLAGLAFAAAGWDGYLVGGKIEVYYVKKDE